MKNNCSTCIHQRVCRYSTEYLEYEAKAEELMKDKLITPINIVVKCNYYAETLKSNFSYTK